MGGTDAVSQLAKKPGLDSGAYSAHLKHVLGLDDRGDTYVNLDVPSVDSTDGSRSIYPLPVIPHTSNSIMKLWSPVGWLLS